MAEERVARGVVERARLAYAMGVFSTAAGGRRLRGKDVGSPITAPTMEEPKDIARVTCERGIELQRIAEYVGVDEETVRNWYERDLPDGIAWDDVREQWDGGLVRLDWNDEGEVDVRLRALAGCEAIMAMALSAMRNVELYDEGAKRVDVLYTKSGTPVQVGGLRPETFSDAQRAYTTAAKLAGEHAAALSKRATMEEMRQKIKVELAAYFARKLELTDAQKAVLAGAVADADEQLMLNEGDRG